MMTDEIFIERYEELLNKGYCDCNEMNILDNNVPRKILNIVKGNRTENRQLKIEIKQLKERLQQREKALNEIKEFICRNREEYSHYVGSKKDWLYIKDKDILQIIDKFLESE